jgi:hypothetical protein
MQCPTCGTNTPGTLGTCSNCNAPIDRPSSPMGAPPPMDFGDSTMVVPGPLGPAPAGGSPAGSTPPAAGTTPPPEFGDSTMVVPPLTPSWSSDPAPSPSPSQASTPPPPSSPLAAPTPLEAPPSDSTSESTAPWSIEDDEDSGGFDTVSPPPPPAWASSSPSPSPQPAPQASPQPSPLEQSDPGGSDSIVPESWFAHPRKPDAQAENAQPLDEQATQMWGGSASPAPSPYPGAAQPTMFDQGYGDTGATQLDHGTMHMGAPMGQPMGPPDMGPPMGGMYPMQPMGAEMGPGGYYPPAKPKGPGAQASKPLLIAVSALVTIAVVAVAMVLWPGGDDTPPVAGTSSPSPSNTQVAQKEPLSSSAKQQATQVNRLLNTSASAKRTLTQAINASARCKTLPKAIRGYQAVAQRRAAQVKRVDELQFDQLRNGERMRSTLKQSFQASLDADLRLLAWANAAKKDCKGRPAPNVAHAPGRTAAERRATASKKQFVSLWNPVAKQAGLPSRVWTGI